MISFYYLKAQCPNSVLFVIATMMFALANENETPGFSFGLFLRDTNSNHIYNQSTSRNSCLQTTYLPAPRWLYPARSLALEHVILPWIGNEEMSVLGNQARPSPSLAALVHVPLTARHVGIRYNLRRPDLCESSPHSSHSSHSLVPVLPQPTTGHKSTVETRREKLGGTSNHTQRPTADSLHAPRL
ncbi:hypothetical protein F5Y03DRAFT_263193 [Xylaria venustula]|nr:hypothetical protein F5Y03DRAFT_263193 [Xylaria venustula]